MLLEETTPISSEDDDPLGRSTLGESITADGPGAVAVRFALTILCHPNLDRVGERALLPELDAGRPAPLSRVQPLFARPRASGGEPLADGHLSRTPIHFRADGRGDVRLEMGDSTIAVVYRDAPVTSSQRFSADQIRRGVVLLLGRRIVLLLHRVRSLLEQLDDAGAPDGATDLVGESDGLKDVLRQIQSVAGENKIVLLRGENGTGKERVARAIHRSSPRRGEPFEAINLAAIPQELASSELFGTEKGAYSSAVHRIGLCERAHRGTLFLDEIGYASPNLQGTLLRFLESGELQTVGARTRKVDVRIIAATDADLEAKMAAATFSAALYGRLSGYEIRIPPLRERRDDVGRLIVHFLRKEMAAPDEARLLRPPAPGSKPWLPAPLVARLADYDWPRNVRELRGVMERLVIENRGRKRVEITTSVDHLLAPTRSSAPPAAVSQRAADDAELERPSSNGHRERMLADAQVYAMVLETRGDLAEAARRLRVSRAYLYQPRFREDIKILRCYLECDGDVGRMAERLGLPERSVADALQKLGLA